MDQTALRGCDGKFEGFTVASRYQQRINVSSHVGNLIPYLIRAPMVTMREIMILRHGGVRNPRRTLILEIAITMDLSTCSREGKSKLAIGMEIVARYI